MVLKRTPIEAVIASVGDRRVRYDDRLRAKGLVKCTVWCSPEAKVLLRDVGLATRVNGDSSALLLERLRSVLRGSRS